MAQCPSCGRLEKPNLICPDCGAPLGADLDCFAALGFPRRLILDPDQLESAYHELGRKIHPDRFANAPAAVREASLRSTALLTRSYRTLKDPVGRGLYWLETNGEKLADNNKTVPPELAEMVFEVQEQLAELREADQEQKPELLSTMRERAAALNHLMEQARQELARNFDAWSGNGAGDPKALTGDLKRILSRIAYLRTLIRDVGRELEPAKAN